MLGKKLQNLLSKQDTTTYSSTEHDSIDVARTFKTTWRYSNLHSFPQLRIDHLNTCLLVIPCSHLINKRGLHQTKYPNMNKDILEYTDSYLSSVCNAEYFTSQSTDEIHWVINWCENGNGNGLTLVHRLPVQHLRHGKEEREWKLTKSSVTFCSNNFTANVYMYAVKSLKEIWIINWI